MGAGLKRARAAARATQQPTVPPVSPASDPVDSPLEKHARRLATYAASINWQPGDNTRDWLRGLRDRIADVQAITAGQPGEMPSDLSLEHLDAEDDT